MISYEWVFEETDEYGDIVDPMFGDTFKEVSQLKPEDKSNDVHIALIRFEGDEDNGEDCREYAYIKDGKLPVEFDDGYRVPKRFHAEVG